MRVVEVIAQEEFSFKSGGWEYTINKGDKCEINPYKDNNGNVMLLCEGKLTTVPMRYFEGGSKKTPMYAMCMMVAWLMVVSCFGQIEARFDNDQIIQHKGYTLSYNEECEQPNWVNYMIRKSDLEKPRVKRTNNFRSDGLIATKSAHKKDYVKSGYDRGHLASAADFAHDAELMSESFYMSNMSPQHPSFNRGVWKKLEGQVREMAMESDSVYVLTGGVLKGDMKHIGTNGVCVPLYYYKVVLLPNGEVTCWYMENKKGGGDLDSYKANLAALEKETGLSITLK